MSKYLLSSVVAGALMVLPVAASAATFSNVMFDNGDVTISGKGGSTVNATFHIVVPANQVIERIQTDVMSDNLAPVCTEVGGDLGLQEGTHDITLPIKLPPNTGTYTLAVQGSGIYGGFRTVDCNNDVVGSVSFSSALRVVSDSSSVVTSSTSTTQWDTLMATLGALIAKLTPATGGPSTPVVTPSAACADLGQYESAFYGSTGQAVVMLQGFLLSKGESIPALAAGASFGFYGPQTMAAVNHFKAMNHCI